MKQTKPFSLKEALNGAKVVTREGFRVINIKQAEEHHFYGPYGMPVTFTVVTSENDDAGCPGCCTVNGESIGNSSSDLFMAE